MGIKLVDEVLGTLIFFLLTNFTPYILYCVINLNSVWITLVFDSYSMKGLTQNSFNMMYSCKSQFFKIFGCQKCVLNEKINVLEYTSSSQHWCLLLKIRRTHRDKGKSRSRKDPLVPPCLDHYSNIEQVDLLSRELQCHLVYIHWKA